LKGFLIAGADGNWHEAKAEIRANASLSGAAMFRGL
jgi:hypothetical protein